MLQTDKLNVSELKKDDVNEIIRVPDNAIDVEGFDYEELTDILEHICVS